MPAIGASDITYTEDAASRNIHGTRRIRTSVYTLTFGDGALTYVVGGLQLDKGKMGCPQNLTDLVVLDSAASGIDWRWARTLNKLKAFLGKDPAAAGGADTPLVEAGAAYAPPAQSLTVRVMGY
jgi:hypothetical protein